MDWKEIKISRDWTYFLFKGKILFDKKFKSLLKFKGRGLAPVEEDSGWYFINPIGETVIQGPFKKAWGFYCGLSAVEDTSGWYHINEDGHAAYSERYTWCGNFQEDLCTVRDKDDQYFHIQKDGSKRYVRSYRYVGDFKDGLASVMLQNGKFKHIDEYGNFIYKPEFNDLGVYHKCYATARDEIGWFHIDLAGNALYKERYSKLEPFYNGVAFGESLSGEKETIYFHGPIRK